MNTSSNTPTTLFVSPTGEMLQSSCEGEGLKPITATAEAKLNRIEILTSVMILTGMTENEIMEYSFKVAIEWLYDYLNVGPSNSEFVEGDVYRLLSNDLVLKWWQNEWVRRDAQHIKLMSEMHKNMIGSTGYKSKEKIREITRFRLSSIYKNLHSLCHKEDSKEYKLLAASYDGLLNVLKKV